MIIRLAKHSGYCFGVKRAITIALDAANLNHKVYTIGPLIHNPQFVKGLSDLGVEVTEDWQNIKDSTVVIRSHGISKEQLKVLYANNNNVIDATCPYVSRTHELVGKLTHEAYPVLILGDANHPEVIGMVSYGKENTTVVDSEWTPPHNFSKKVGVISQTTQKIENLHKLVSDLLPVTNELRVFNTICCATSQRQSSAKELAKCSDLMIVIGGKNSSNTKMLALLCSELTETLYIETEDELNPGDFIGKEKIGLCAGASTPDGAITAVYNRIKEINGEVPNASGIEDIPLFKEESC